MQIFEPVLETILGDRTVHVAKATNHRFLTLQRTKEQYNQLVLEAIHAAAAPAAQQDLSVADKNSSLSDVLVWIRDRPALTIQHTSLLTGLPLQNPDEHVDPFNFSYVKLTAQLPSENPHDAKMLPDEMLLNPDKLNDAGNRSVGPQTASSPADQHDVALIIEDKTSTLASRGKKRPSSFLVSPESNEQTADEASTDVISVIENNNGNVPDNNYEDIIGEILSDHPSRALKRNATLSAKADLAKTTNAKKLPPKVASVPSNSVAKIANKTATKATITAATIIPTEHTTIECIPKTTTASSSAITTTATTKVTSPSITTATDASTRLDKGKAKVIDLASSKVVAADAVNSSPVEKDKSTEGQQRETANSLAVKSSTLESTPTKQWVYRSTDIGVLKPTNTVDRKRKTRETVCILLSQWALNLSDANRLTPSGARTCVPKNHMFRPIPYLRRASYCILVVAGPGRVWQYKDWR